MVSLLSRLLSWPRIGVLDSFKDAEHALFYVIFERLESMECLIPMTRDWEPPITFQPFGRFFDVISTKEDISHRIQTCSIAKERLGGSGRRDGYVAHFFIEGDHMLFRTVWGMRCDASSIIHTARMDECLLMGACRQMWI